MSKIEVHIRNTFNWKNFLWNWVGHEESWKKLKKTRYIEQVMFYPNSSFVLLHSCFFFLLLQVSLGSQVRFKPENFSLFTRIQQETFPHGNEQLLNWAQKKYRAVTSFSELKMTQDIYIKVGEGVHQIPKIPKHSSGPQGTPPPHSPLAFITLLSFCVLAQARGLHALC